MATGFPARRAGLNFHWAMQSIAACSNSFWLERTTVTSSTEPSSLTRKLTITSPAIPARLISKGNFGRVCLTGTGAVGLGRSGTLRRFATGSSELTCFVLRAATTAKRSSEASIAFRPLKMRLTTCSLSCGEAYSQSWIVASPESSFRLDGKSKDFRSRTIPSVEE